MRISQLSLEGRGAWPDLHIDRLNPQLNVFCASAQAGKSTIARLVGHLLYGKNDSPWRQHVGQSVLAEGTISLDGDQGQFILRRHRDSGSQEKLTIASANGRAVDSRTVRSLLSNLSPELASQLFAVDFAQSPAVEWLLSEDFSRQYVATQQTASPEFTANLGYRGQSDADVAEDRIDRRRVDELVRRRNTIAHEIEQQLAIQRREDGVLERELIDLDEALTSKRQLAKKLRAKLRAIESQLAEIEARLRYFSLENTVKRDASNPIIERHSQELHELDAEITRCRQTLSDLQARDVVVRTELARLSPDGTADTVTCLADGRTTLTVMERLLDDLDAEVAQLARANEPGRGVRADAHAKLSPVAEMLRQQVYTLCGQLTEQDRIARRHQASAELRQLSRTQTDLSERLELLLSRRELLVQESQHAGRPFALSPQPPAADHCRCDRHGHFVLESEATVLWSGNRQQIENDIHGRRGALERERTELVDELTALHLDIERIELRWKDLQRQRGGLLGGSSIEDKRAELARLEAIINQLLQATVEPNSPPSQEIWRASDVLAQLTDGELVQIQLDRRGRRTSIIDRIGRTLQIEALSPAQYDAMYLALTLALVASYARRGIELPLILDEPFLRQDAAGAAAMAGVLHEFSHAGHQLLVFTEDRDARRRFESLGTAVFDLESLRRKPVTTASFAATLAPKESTTCTRVVRETTDGPHAPILRLAPVSSESNSDDVFYLAETSLLGEFPVLGSETSAAFAQLEIRSVGDLLAADADNVARRLGRSEVLPETVRLWQTHMGLMCYVPELTLNDAQILSANGVNSLEDLFDADADVLLRTIESFLRTNRGRRFASSRSRYNRRRIAAWIRGAARNRNRWNRSRSRYRWSRSGRSTSRSRSTRQDRSKLSPQRQSRSENEQTYQQASQPSERRFYLQRNSDVEDAPSIGPKTASRLARVGIRTVADLLNADPESTAEELNVSHIKAATIAAWQHQARLVCRIPQLRGLGAQLLVACGFTEPEQVSGADAKEVATKILAFCNTKKGQRLLRNGDAPSRETVETWIESAGHTRPLEAA